VIATGVPRAIPEMLAKGWLHPSWMLDDAEVCRPKS
jgi:hypothetical protein